MSKDASEILQRHSGAESGASWAEPSSLDCKITKHTSTWKSPSSNPGFSLGLVIYSIHILLSILTVFAALFFN